MRPEALKQEGPPSQCIMRKSLDTKALSLPLPETIDVYKRQVVSCPFIVRFFEKSHWIPSKKGYKIGIFFAVVNVGLKFERI